MLDGISRIPNLVARTKELGMDSLAITDHGTFYGVVDFYSACKEVGIKPIIGCEVYVAHNSRFDKDPSERSPNHLVLLARDNIGYRNLMQLVTKAHVDGFHYRPRIDKGLLEEFGQGLAVLSACPSAEVPRLLADGNDEAAALAAAWYKERFGDGYFLEIQRHEHVPQLPKINEGLIAMGRKLDIPLVVTNDAHYVNQVESPLQDIYICIQTSTTVNDEKRLRWRMILTTSRVRLRCFSYSRISALLWRTLSWSPTCAMLTWTSARLICPSIRRLTPRTPMST